MGSEIKVENQMDNTPSPKPKDQTAEPPAPEVLASRTDDSLPLPETPATPSSPIPLKSQKRPHRNAHLPSHKATFIGLAVVILILAVNTAIIGFVLKGQSKSKDLGSQGQVSISQSALDKLGVNRSAVGDAGIELVVGPNARFNGSVKVGSDVSIAGQLKLSNKFSAPDANLAQLEAGNTSLSALNVNGDATVSNLNLRGNLLVNGTTRLQGTVTISQLLTVNNSLNVAGNLAVGGTLAIGTLSVGALNVGGHVITSGSSPVVSAGACVGSNGTVSISGNDQAGTVAVNVGVNPCPGGGPLANITFHNRYGNTPHVVITPIGQGLSNFYVNRSATGFIIGGSPSPGGYAFDYIVEQ